MKSEIIVIEVKIISKHSKPSRISNLNFFKINSSI